MRILVLGPTTTSIIIMSSNACLWEFLHWLWSTFPPMSFAAIFILSCHNSCSSSCKLQVVILQLLGALHLCKLSWLPSATRCGPASAGSPWVFLFPGASFSPQKPQVTDLKRFPNESYSCLCTCLTCPNPSTPGWKRFVNQPMSGFHLVQNVASFHSIRCRRSRYLPLRMKAHGPRQSSRHPHRAKQLDLQIIQLKESPV